MKRILILLLSINLSLIALAQGNSIPKGSKANAQAEALPEILPEGVKYRYPMFNGLSVSVNAFDPVMELFKWEHANYEAVATVDLYHRFFPQVVVGMGHCNQENDYGVKFRSKAAPFVKVGMLYNFKYNELKPEDFYYVVFRYGMSKSSADIKNLTFTDGYWKDYGPADIDNQEYKCHWIEIGGGIKVKVTGPISLGWELTLRPLIAKGEAKGGNPYFVPGLGTGKFNFGFNIYYDIF